MRRIKSRTTPGICKHYAHIGENKTKISLKWKDKRDDSVTQAITDANNMQASSLYPNAETETRTETGTETGNGGTVVRTSRSVR